MTHPSDRVSVAVIGMACRYPDAGTPRELWENILAKRRAFRPLPDCRLRRQDYVDTSRKTPDTTYAHRAAVIDGFNFDWAARRIPKTTVASTDIVHWLALEIALAAIADAGYDPAAIPGKNTGVIVGNTLTGEQTRSATMRLRWPYVRRALQGAASGAGLDKRQLEALEAALCDRYKAAFPPVTEDTLAGGLANTIAGRICHYLDLQGGGYTVDGACSSSLIAVATAAARLADGDLDLAVVGGVDVSLDPFELVGFAKTGALSAGDMNVYDRRGRGFIPGEGCGFVVLKRLADARRDGNTIYAVINGWGISSDGRGAGITAPTVRGQVLALERAYANNPITPQSLDFIEGHGTGTSVGDPIELTAIHNVLGARNGTRPRFCGITSLKSIIGHTKAASGIGGLIKAVMAVNRRVIPPLAGCREPHPLFETELAAIYPVRHGECREKEAVLKAGVSSMGFGGINCHVTLCSHDAPHPGLDPVVDENALLASAQTSELFVLESASPEAMVRRIEELARTADGISMAELADLAAHTAEAVTHQAPWRAALVAADPETLSRSLATLTEYLRKGGERVDVADQKVWMAAPSGEPRIGFLFPGQGAQQINMARTLVQRFAWGRDLLALAERCTGTVDGRTLGQWIYRDPERARDKGQLDQWRRSLAETRLAQPAVCLASALWLKFLESLGIRPASVGGHSLGELTALYAAGAMDAETLFATAARRGRIMARSRPGAMAALGCDQQQAGELIAGVQGYVTVANLNAPDQTVVSGEQAAVAALADLARSRGLGVKSLAVSGAFHSGLMAEAAAEFTRTADLPSVIENLRCPVFSALKGRRLNSGADMADYLSRQMVSPVNFIGMLEAMAPEVDLWVEVGPGKVLSGLVGAIQPQRRDRALPVEAVAESWESIHRMLAQAFVAGARIQWPALYRHRLVRPFVPAHEKHFIANHCESVDDLPLAVATSPVGRSMDPLWDQLRDLPADTVRDYLERRGGFLARVIRADLELPSSGNVDQVSETTDPANSTPPVADRRPPVTPASNGDLREHMLSLVAEVTGFDKATLSLESRLLDDLNLDSIKAGDLLARLAGLAGIQWPDDPAVLANARLEEIEAAVKQLQQQQPGRQDGDHANASQASPAAYAPPSWVRNFELVWRPAPLEDANGVGFGQGTTVLVLHDPSAEAIAHAIQSNLETRDAKVTSRTFQWALDQDPQGLEAYDIRIAVMPTGTSDLDDLGRELPQMVARRAALLRSVAGEGRGTAFVQFGGGRFGRTPASANLKATACSALAASVHHEFPQSRLCVVDLPMEWPAERIAETVIMEMSAGQGFSAAGYDEQGQRRVWAPRLSQPVTYAPRPIRYTADEVILVSGGGKGITAECAMAAAREVGAHLALIGSSPLEPGSPVETQLARLAREGIEARYYRCDITRRRSVRDTVAEIRRTQGPIKALIHGAGLNRPRPAREVTAEDASAEVAPKVAGFLNLWSALRDAPPDLVVGLSSIIGLTGMPGNAWYGFANEALDILLQAVEADSPTTRTQSVAFSVWRDTGMGARMGSVSRLSQMGIDAIPTDEGCRRFARLFTHTPGSGAVVVTARLGGLDTWPAPFPRMPAIGRFCRQPVMLTPGIEAVFRVHLDPDTDLYLQDHVFQGSHLFPTVFGLEAMAQAALAAAGLDDISGIGLEGVALKRPITVDPQHGADLILWAQVVETDRGDGTVAVRAGIHKEGGGGDHFQAVIRLNPAAQPNGSALATMALQPETAAMQPRDDLYRETLLFQGPRFQRIRRVLALEGNNRDRGRALLQVGKADIKSAAQAAFAPSVRQPLVLPDPFFSDALLQSAALLVPQDTSLPVAIDRIVFSPDAFDIQGDLKVQVNLDRRVDRTFHARVLAVDEAGRPVMRMDGYRLQILKHHAAYPALEDLKRPRHRDRRLLTEGFQQAARAFDLQPPEIDLDYLSGIHQLPKDRRHQAEGPLLEDLVSRARRRWPQLDGDLTVDWVKNGKPVLEGQDGGGFGLSLSHDARLCLSVMGPGLQGCDITPIEARTRDGWLDLLGRSNEGLLEQLMNQGDTLDEAGARVWSAREAAVKALGVHIRVAMTVLGHRDNAVLLEAEGDNRHRVAILTRRVHLTWDHPKMAAMVMHPIERKPSKTYPESYAGLCAEPAYKILPAGPHGELIFVQRFPVTFKPSAQLSRYVYFSHYFDWMGQAREASTWPVMKDLIALLSTGQWGSVTNYSRLQVFGEVRTGDLVQLRMWTSDNGGPCNGTMSLQYEFVQLLPDGGRHLLALAELQTTWVALSGPGIAKPAPYPDVLQKFFDDMIPREGPLQPDTRLPSRFKAWHDRENDAVYEAPAGPVIRPQLAMRTFDTSLGQANAVGNVYYANYYEWQGALRDHYLQKLLPEYFEGVGESGEAICLACRVDHLREAMPFDRIMVTMALKTLYDSRAMLQFDYYRVDEGAAPVKLAWGSQLMVWVERDRRGIPREAPFPDALRNAMAAAIIKDPDVPVMDLPFQAPAAGLRASAG